MDGDTRIVHCAACVCPISCVDITNFMHVQKSTQVHRRYKCCVATTFVPFFLVEFGNQW